MARHIALTILVASIVPMLGGCFLVKKPNPANIELRKQNQALEDKLASLQRKSDGDAAMIKSLQDKVGTLPTLPKERLDKLFTTHGIQIGKLTGGADIDPNKPGYEGLVVHVTPLDEAGDVLKAAGSFKVEAFDVSEGQGAKIGTWNIDGATAKPLWNSVLGRHEYVLTLPWQTPPSGTKLHLDVTFTDELTQAQFEKTVDVTLDALNAK